MACRCGNAACLGPDPRRPDVHHRVPCRIVAVRQGFAEAQLDGLVGIRWFLLIGRQIEVRDAVVGQQGFADYGRSGLDHFRPIALHGCARFAYREAGSIVHRVCQECGHTERGRWAHVRDGEDT